MPAAKKTAPTPAAKKATVKKLPPKPAKQAIEREVQNDVTRPAPGTKTGRVWEIFDKLSGDAPASRASVIEAAAKEDIPEATVATQYQRLRVFYGITERSARTAKVAPAKPAKKEAAKPTKAPAKKAAAKKAAPKPPAKKRVPKAPAAEAAAE